MKTISKAAFKNSEQESNLLREIEILKKLVKFLKIHCIKIFFMPHISNQKKILLFSFFNIIIF